MDSLWQISESTFEKTTLHHKETIFTIGNGYLATRGAFEEGFPGDHRATFIHGVFDYVPISLTELANAPDWLPLTVLLNGERFSLDSGQVESYERSLDLHTGLLKRSLRWRSPSGFSAQINFQRFTSLADEHLLYIRCEVIPAFDGNIEIRANLNGCTDNEGYAHWQWISQFSNETATCLRSQTRKSHIELAAAMQLKAETGEVLESAAWDAENSPTRCLRMRAIPGKPVCAIKTVAIFTSRDTSNPAQASVDCLRQAPGWMAAFQDHSACWADEWERSDIIIEGDDEAQIAIRFNLFQMLIAAPRHDDRVNIGAKTLSGFGYRGHSFWDTEIFMLPLFIYTAPEIARNLLNYRYQRLPQARQKALSNGYEGAQFPWESADTGEEVTPTWIPHFTERNKLVRIWTGDIEIHISADIAYAAWQYWHVTGDDAWFIEKGAELILDTAKFWASRAEWDEEHLRYEYNDVIGPDENHDHVDNNAYTNRMAQWNLQTALEILEWLKERAPEKVTDLTRRLDLTPLRLAKWQDVIKKIYMHVEPDGVIEQFEGYFQRKYVDLAALEPRDRAVQVIYGIEGAAETQVIKQPDVLMMQYLLHDHYSSESIRVNYEYYTPRTDHTYGSSLGPSIQAIMACEVGKVEDAYEHFIRAVRADLRDVRGNAGDGIHAASAGGTWQAVVFGFAGLRITSQGWKINPRLPKHWRRLAFTFIQHGQVQVVDIKP